MSEYSPEFKNLLKAISTTVSEASETETYVSVRSLQEEYVWIHCGVEGERLSNSHVVPGQPKETVPVIAHANFIDDGPEGFSFVSHFLTVTGEVISVNCLPVVEKRYLLPAEIAMVTERII